MKFLQSKLLHTRGVNDLSIHLNVADVQYAWSDTHHKDVTSIAFIGRDAIRTHYRDRVADRCRTFPLGARCGFSTHVAQWSHMSSITAINVLLEFSRSASIRALRRRTNKWHRCFQRRVPTLNLQFRLQQY